MVVGFGVAVGLGVFVGFGVSVGVGEGVLVGFGVGVEVGDASIIVGEGVAFAIINVKAIARSGASNINIVL